MIQIVCTRHKASQLVAVFEKAVRRREHGRFIDPPVYGVPLVEPDETQAPVWHIMEGHKTTGGIRNPDGSHVMLDRGVRAVRVSPDLRDEDADRLQPGDLQVVEVLDGEVVAFAQRALTRGQEPGQPGYIWAWSRTAVGDDPAESVQSTGAPRHVTLTCPRCRDGFRVGAARLIPVLDASQAADERRLPMDRLRAGVARVG